MRHVLVPVLFLFVAACAAAPSSVPVSSSGSVLASTHAHAHAHAPAAATVKPDKTSYKKPLPKQETIKLSRQYLIHKHASLLPAELPSPDQLMGLPRHQLSDVLGTPNFIHHDISTEIWQYRDDACILDIFLYKKNNIGDFRVSYLEARTLSVVKITLGDCYLGIIRGNSKKEG